MSEIKSRRLQLRLSQSELARLSGVSRFKICLHELGDKPLGVSDLATVNAALTNFGIRMKDSIDTAIAVKPEAK